MSGDDNQSPQKLLGKRLLHTLLRMAASLRYLHSTSALPRQLNLKRKRAKSTGRHKFLRRFREHLRLGQKEEETESESSRALAAGIKANYTNVCTLLHKVLVLRDPNPKFERGRGSACMQALRLYSKSPRKHICMCIRVSLKAFRLGTSELDVCLFTLRK